MKKKTVCALYTFLNNACSIPFSLRSRESDSYPKNWNESENYQKLTLERD